MSRANLTPGEVVAAKLVEGIVGFFLKGWLLMLVLGGLHHEVSGNVPAVGYFGALLVVLAANLLVGTARAVRSADTA